MRSVRGLLTFSWLLLACAIVCSGQLAAIVSDELLQSLGALAQQKVAKETAPRAVMYASEVVLASGGDCKFACTALEQLQQQARSTDEVYYSSVAVKNCRCKSSVSSTQAAEIRHALKTDTLPTLAWGVLGAQYADQVNVDAETVSQQLYALLDADGLFKSTTADETGSIDNTLAAMDALAHLADSLRDSAAAATLSAVVDRVSNLLPGGKDKHAHATLITPLSRLTADGNVPKVGASRVLAIGDLLVSLAHGSDLEQAHRALAGLHTLQGSRTSPIYAALKRHAFNANEDVELRVSIVTALNKPADVEDIEITFVTAADGEHSVIATPIRMVADSSAASTFTATLSGLSVGIYKVQMGVNVQKRVKRVPVNVSIVIQESAKINEVEIGVSETPSIAGADMSVVKQQGGLAGLHASADSFEVLHIRFSVIASRRPHQAVVRMRHVDSGADHFFIAQISSSNANKHMFTTGISLAHEAEKLSYRNGRYTLALFVADVSYSTSLEWVIGSVEVQLPSKPRREYPLYARALLHDSDTTLTALPEIHHQFRPDAARPPMVVSALFTVLLLVPFAALIWKVIQIKPEFKQIDVYGLAYMGCIAAVLVLYAMYWLAIPLMIALKYLAPLAVVTIIVGQLALRSATARRSAAAVESTKDTKLD